jgi:hypothetical protein
MSSCSSILVTAAPKYSECSVCVLCYSSTSSWWVCEVWVSVTLAIANNQWDFFQNTISFKVPGLCFFQCLLTSWVACTMNKPVATTVLSIIYPCISTTSLPHLEVIVKVSHNLCSSPMNTSPTADTSPQDKEKRKSMSKDRYNTNKVYPSADILPVSHYGPRYIVTYA